MDAKHEDILKHAEVANDGTARQRHYQPATDEEKALDRRVNLKLDTTVVLILAIGFIVSTAI